MHLYKNRNVKKINVNCRFLIVLSMNMIIKCSSCAKKFNVPDQAIKAEGRLVQCSSCGNKWTQFPIKTEKKVNIVKPNIIKLDKKKSKPKKRTRKETGPTIYSSEYLEKKHGLKIKDSLPSNKKTTKTKKIQSAGFGFYGWILIFSITLITLSGILNLTSEIIIYNFPYTEIYINYFFETLININEIIRDFFANY